MRKRAPHSSVITGRERAQNYSFGIALNRGIHSLRKALISANYDKAVQVHVAGVFGLLLAGSRCGAYVLEALAGGSIKEPAQYFKSASEIRAYFLGTEVGFFSALVGLGLS